MYTERLRQDGQHTAFITAYLIEVNRSSKKTKQVRPEDLNPMEVGNKGSKGKGIPLNSEEGFLALYQIAKLCQRRSSRSESTGSRIRTNGF
jgi:hypothetical protein